MISAFRSQKKFQKKKDLRLEQEALPKKSGKILQFKKNRESIAQSVHKNKNNMNSSMKYGFQYNSFSFSTYPSTIIHYYMS